MNSTIPELLIYSGIKAACLKLLIVVLLESPVSVCKNYIFELLMLSLKGKTPKCKLYDTKQDPTVTCIFI